MLNPTSTDPVGAALLASFRHNFRMYKTLADRALAQLSEAEWLHQPAPGSNSAAVIVQHLVGNLRSRFTDLRSTITTRGEAFQSLSIPRGQSQEFNHQLAARS
ncbi:DUF1572 family protein [Hymenobacter antarcticus]|uniref:DUF1572 domain-containing protein n=1 Tax=Hymenobacter antarcticus TaxID=486270 RepID=A0ABP7PFM7_9BACT